MRFSALLATFVIFVILSICTDLATSQDEDFDIEKDLESRPAVSAHHRANKRHKSVEKPENFEIDRNTTSTTSSKKIHHTAEKEQATKIQTRERKSKRQGKGKIDSNLHKAEKEGKRKLKRDKLAERQRDWNYCSDGSVPKEVKFHEPKPDERGHMCRDMYPVSTCCYGHDLSMELVGGKIIEQVPELECARILMLLQCAHCSPRSWWLFHAPDMVRYPHKRVLPIMCPGFCRRFQRACQDSVEGLRGDNFCDFHTTAEDGPCFPDSFVKKGTID